MLSNFLSNARPFSGLGLIPLLIHLPATAQQEAAADRIEQVIVSASRDSQQGLNLALPWSRIDQDAVNLTGAVHINQLTQRVPGTWISRGNGQESLTALRSPVLTGGGGCGPFFMAWDGISLRGTGFCNVNQLFDANSEQAGAVEVIRGPGTAVYGANAMHGVINILSRDPRDATGQRYAIEAGPNDYYRLRVDAARDAGAHAYGVYFNGTMDGGFKNDSGFDQQKMTLKHNYAGDIWNVTNALELSNLNQETSGFVRGFEAYEDPEQRRNNPNPEAYRDSYSARAYSRWERDLGSRKLTITPYARRTGMEFLQHFLPWQATEKNGQTGAGVQLVLSDDTGDRLRWRSGIDLDLTNGWLEEVQEEPFSPNQPQGVHYDYEVDALSLAAYVQGEYDLSEAWTLSGGVRLERNEYDYETNAPAGSACAPEASACRFFRPEDREDTFNNGSVSLGLTYSFSEAHRFYTRVARGFRPPQTSELYRLQAGQEIADLDSETINSIDVGLRGLLGSVSYDVSLYSMRKEDVIFQDADRQNVSGAETSHNGLEFSVYWTGDNGWYAGVDGNIARHRYESDANLLGSRIDIEGNDIDTAPREFGSARVGRRGSLFGDRQGTVELEWVHLGEYYLDPDNAHKYEGHDLLNLRLQTAINSGLSATLRVTNLLDEEYAERADFGFGSYRYFVGEPRGFYFEIAYRRP